MSKGPAFLLKIRNGDSYQTVAGMREETLTVDNGFLHITAAGIFLGSAAEAIMRSAALSGERVGIELSYETGDKLRAELRVSHLSYGGDFNGERNYRLTLAGTAVAGAGSSNSEREKSLSHSEGEEK